MLETSDKLPRGMDKHSIQDRAYFLLKGLIDKGQLAPGDRLLEAQVSRAFGISRSPARHALQLLCKEQLIREAAGRGYEVAAHNGQQAPRAALGFQHRLAILDTVKILPAPQWERMYAQLERELCARIIFSSVRIVEERLAEHFSVSRTVVRDVLARMHSVGLVSKDSMGRWIAPHVTPAKTHHLYELRWLLEPPALLQAAQHVPRSYLERAHETVTEALNGFPRQGFDTDVVENDLHVTLLAYCLNDDIVHSLGRTRVLFVPTRYLFDPILHIPLDLIEDALCEHKEIYELLLAGKADHAAQALFTHLQRADERWLERFNRVAQLKQKDALPAYLMAI
jgi:DNA-binding GntR family transcriptional regulator